MLLRANFRKSSEIIFDLLTTPWQIPWDNNVAASTINRSAQRSSCIYATKQEHLHHQVHEWPHCLDKLQYFETTLIHTQLTKDSINWDIDHQASTINVSTSSTVFSNIYNLTIQLQLQSAPNTETILTF